MARIADGATAARRWGWRASTLKAVVLSTLIASAGWGLWIWLAPTDAGSDPETKDELRFLRGERRRLTRELRQAQKQAEDLRGQQRFSARSCDIDAMACEEGRRSLAGLEKQVADLREQLVLYKSIVSPEKALAGVQVLSMTVQPSDRDAMWHYDLVLVQPVRRDRVATGTFEITVEGTQQKKSLSLNLAEMVIGKREPASFNFRSFQEFSGDLVFPARFVPSRIIVTLAVNDGRAENRKVSEAFEWSRLVSTD